MIQRLKFLFTVVIILSFTQHANSQLLDTDHSPHGMNVAWLSDGEALEVLQYDKLEVGITLPERIQMEVNKFVVGYPGINPFDPEEIDIECNFERPDGTMIKRNGFFYQDFKVRSNSWVRVNTPFPWRIRFCPDTIGTWKMHIRAHNGSWSYLEERSYEFHCKPSDIAGPLVMDSTGTMKDRYPKFKGKDSTFFGIGHNICHANYYGFTPVDMNDMTSWITELKQVGGNLTRIEIGAQNCLPYWPENDNNSLVNYSQKMDQMWGYDSIFEHLRKNEMYFITFRHHTEALSGPNYDVSTWEKNPFHLNFHINTIEQFFTSDELFEIQKKSLRYMLSRWGYSPQFMSYSFSEVDNWLKVWKAELIDAGVSEKHAEKKVLISFSNWLVKTKNYIQKELDFKDIKVIGSFTSNLPDFEKDKGSKSVLYNSDFKAFHQYGFKKDLNTAFRFRVMSDFIEDNRPLLMEEIGPHYTVINKFTTVNFHNNIWSSVFHGGFGTGMHWWWDRGIHEFGHLNEYKPIYNFIEKLDLNSYELLPKIWVDGGYHTRTLENHYMVDIEGEYGAGWIHNATVHWRNLVHTNEEIRSLVETGKPSQSFHYADDKEDGHEVVKRFARKDYPDKYTASGPIEINPPSSNSHEKFKIKGLKKNTKQAFWPWTKKHWYEITYYPTKEGEIEEIETERLPANNNGTLSPKVPHLSLENPDFAYEIKYIGYQKRVRAKF